MMKNLKEILILDVSTRGRVRGIEVINAAQFFKEFEVEEKIFKNLVNADFNTSIKPDSIIIGITFKVKNIKQEIPAKIAIPLDVPSKSF